MSEYFPESKSSGGRVKAELNLSIYATKVDLKNITGVDTSDFTKVLLSYVVKNDVLQKDVYNAQIRN